MLKTYGAAPYGAELKKLEKEIKDKQQTINEKIGKSPPGHQSQETAPLTRPRC